MLIQTFEEVATGERFTIAVNHLKSKGSSCNSVSDPDRLDGQANCPGTRTSAAEALVDYLATDPTGSGDPDFSIVGDLNSYKSEDPIVALKDGGLHRPRSSSSSAPTRTASCSTVSSAISTMRSPTRASRHKWWARPSGTSTATKCRCSTTTTRSSTSGEASFERESSALPLYDATADPDPRRSSDHDPVVLGLALDDGIPDPGPCSATVEELEDAGFNVILGNDTGETLTGTKQKDAIFGGDGNDTIDGAKGNDLLCGEGGNDEINGGDGNDTIDGGNHDDEIDGGGGADTIAGGRGNDTVNGAGGNDIITGGDGDDTLTGDKGSDVLVGGLGSDTAVGGKGSDNCVAETTQTCES